MPEASPQSPDLEVNALLQLHRDERDQGRQSETQRSTLTNFVITVSGILIAFVANLKFRKSASLPSAFVIVLGVYGAVASSKLHERWDLARERADRFRQRIDALLGSRGDGSIEEMRWQASREDRRLHPFLYGRRLNSFWVVLNLFIALIGLVSLLITLISHRID